MNLARGVKKALKILLYTIGGVVLFLVLLAGITQTQFFRDRLRFAVLTTLDSLLLAEVQLGDLHGNLVTGFSVDSISIRVRDAYLIRTERLELKYNLFDFSSKRISVDKLTLIRPQITLTRGMDGLWNFHRMVRSGDSETGGEPGGFDWPIAINVLDIREGSISLVDSAALTDPYHPAPHAYFVEYHDVALSNFNLQASLVVSEGEKRAVISTLAFASARPEVVLERLSGELLVTGSRASVKDMVIKTSRSSLTLSASMENVDILGGIELAELQHNPVKLSLRAQDVDLNELKRFIDDIDFLNGTVMLDLEADGEFGELNVTRLNLRTGATSLSLSGVVANLHAPHDLYLDVKATKGIISPSDPLHLLPTMHLPDFSHVGDVQLKVLEYTGKPLDFRSVVDVETRHGAMLASVAMQIGGARTLAYTGSARFAGLDLAGVFNDGSLAGSLNGTLAVDGAGVAPEALTGSLTLQFDSSEFLSRPLVGTSATLTANRGHITGGITLGLGEMTAVVEGELVLRAEESPTFALEGRVGSLNLADLTRNRNHTSDLTLSFGAQGTGLSWNALNADFRLSLSPSRYREYEVTSGDVSIFVDQRDPLNKEFKLESNIADFALTGAFDTQYLEELIRYEVLSLRRAIGERFGVLDSSLVTGIDPRELEQLGSALRSRNTTLDMHYALHLKNLEPVSIVAGDRTFNGAGRLTGAITGGFDNLSMSGDLVLEDFIYGNVEAGVLMQDAVASFQVNDLHPVQPLRDMELRLMINARKMHINRTEFDSLALSMRYEQEYASYTGSAVTAGTTRMALSGLARSHEDTLEFTLNDVRLAYNDYAWSADGGAVIGFTPRSLWLDNIVLRRDTQFVSIEASFSENRLQARVFGDHLDMRGLKYLFAAEEQHQGFTGSASLEASASGSLEHPEYVAHVRAGRVAFRTVPLGEVEAQLRYVGGILHTDAVVHNGDKQRRPDLVIAGTIPIDLSLAGDGETTGGDSLGLRITSEGLQMSFLDPLLPTFNQLTGILHCDITLAGSRANPRYDGTISIDSCAFLFVPNNIFYTFEGRFRPQGDRIHVEEAIIRNVPRDNVRGRNGVVTISGDLSLREFKPSDFDLSARGQLLIVKESTRRSSLSLSGELFAEIGPRGLRYTGTIDRSLLRGSLAIRNSMLVFPPTQQSGELAASAGIPVIIVDDTLRARQGDARSVREQYFAVDDDWEYRRVVPVNGDLPTKSFLDGMAYDLEIEASGGDNQIQMIFSAAPREELMAYIDGKFTIVGDGTQWVGELSIDRAHYIFYKRFDANGKIRFTGDLMNPELDISARHEGTRSLAADSINGHSENIVVNLKITGTRTEPKLDLSMAIDGVDYNSYAGPKSSDVQSDAVTFIIAGNFPLTRSEKSDIASDLGTTLGSSLFGGATSLLSNTLSDFVRREVRFIRSVDFGYRPGGSFAESADIRITGTIGKGLVRYQGLILSDPLSSANVSLLYSFGDILQRPALRNFMLELERKVETGSLGQTLERKEINSARLFYRISF